MTSKNRNIKKSSQLYQQIKDNIFCLTILSITPRYTRLYQLTQFTITTQHNWPSYETYTIYLPDWCCPQCSWPLCTETPTLQTFRCINLDLSQDMNWKLSFDFFLLIHCLWYSARWYGFSLFPFCDNLYGGYRNIH